MTDTPTLAPCPFCGDGQTGIESSTYRQRRIRCGDGDCFVAGPWAPTAAEAVTAWNTRASGWIRVEDRLPEPMDPMMYGEEVFIACRGGHRATAILTQDSQGWWSRDDNIYPMANVTHWMPLPDPPEEKE